MDEERLENLEIKASYLEAMVAELNDVVVAQRRELDSTKAQLESLKEKVGALMEDVGTPNRPQRRPPHY